LDCRASNGSTIGLQYIAKEVERNGRGLTDKFYLNELKKEIESSVRTVGAPADVPNGNIPDTKADSRTLVGKIT
jgi:hypothetical protein